MNLQRSIKYGTNKDDMNVDKTLSVATYNILADFHITEDGYPKVAGTEYLYRKNDEGHRHHLLLRELDFLLSDIFLLQEIDSWYEPILSEELKSRGYETSYWCKQSPDLEGNAICYKVERFEMIESYKGYYNDDIALLSNSNNVNPQLIETKLKKTHGYQMCVLKDKKVDKLIILGTTHIVWEDAKQPGLQTLHASLFCKQIHQISTKISEKYKLNINNIPIIIGGDFNSEPDWLLVDLMTKGSLNINQIEKLKYLTYEYSKDKKGLVQMTSKVACPSVEFFSDQFNNYLNLSSAYKDVLGKEPMVTSADDLYVGVLDYIFYTPQVLAVHSILNIDEDSAFEFSKGGPSQLFSSDHLPLKAVFVWK